MRVIRFLFFLATLACSLTSLAGTAKHRGLDGTIWKVTAIEKYGAQHGIGEEISKESVNLNVSFSKGKFTRSDLIDITPQCSVTVRNLSRLKYAIGLLPEGKTCLHKSISGKIYELQFKCPDAISPSDSPFPKYIKVGTEKAIAFEDGAALCLTRQP